MFRWIAAALVVLGSSVRSDGTAEAWPSIETARKWIEYEVRADSFAEATAQCRQLGKSGWAGFTEWDLAWRYDFGDYRFDVRSVGDRQLLAVRGIEVTLTSVKVEQTTHLPRLFSGDGFSDEDRQAWERWYAELRGHELAHQRISSSARIEAWLRRRVAGIRYLESTFPAGQELGERQAKQVIHTELSKVYNHAVARIRDKNAELDQRTAHGPVELDWDEFLDGYF